jgi:hypothetical protein
VKSSDDHQRPQSLDFTTVDCGSRPAKPGAASLRACICEICVIGG